MKSPQSCQMDLGFALFSVCVMTVCLLGAARCSNDISRCQCPDVPSRHLTLPLLPNENCFEINQTFRYKCKGDHLRKVGTSGLIKCKKTRNDPPQWSDATLKCIPDPNKTTAQPPTITATTDPESTATKGHTDIPHDSTIATTVTTSSSPQMTQSLSPSASVPAEPERPEPTSPGLQATSGHSQAGKKQTTTTTHRTPATSTAAVPPDHRESDAHALPQAARTAIGCASVVSVFALIGISFYCYRRRSNKDYQLARSDEQMPMKDDPSMSCHGEQQQSLTGARGTVPMQ